MLGTEILTLLAFALAGVVAGVVGWVICFGLALWHLPALLSVYFECKAKSQKHPKEFSYGRYMDQDYRNFLGHSFPNPETKNKELQNRLHAKIGRFPNGISKESLRLVRNKAREHDYVYRFSEEDQIWLQKEKDYQLSYENWRDQWNFVRACLKGSVPILGMIWIYCTETGLGGGSTIGCTVCMMGGDSNEHWSLPEALSYHLNQISLPIQYRGLTPD